MFAPPRALAPPSFRGQNAAVSPPFLTWRLPSSRAVLLAALAFPWTTNASGQPAGPHIETWSSATLKRIETTGVVRLGYRENSPPFAFVDANKKPIGYSLDICEVVVEEIAREVGREVTAEYLPVTPENRFDRVTTGAIDLECGSTTNTAERRQMVAFSPTIFVTGTKLMVKRDSGIRSIANLKGRSVVVIDGTTNQDAVKFVNEKRNLGITLLSVPDRAQGYAMSKQVSGFHNLPGALTFYSGTTLEETTTG